MNAFEKFNNISKSVPLIAILRGITPNEVIDISRALIEAGIRIIEVPLNSPDALTSIEKLCQTFKADALCGAGTVTHPGLVAPVLDCGAELIVSPNLNHEVIKQSHSAGAIMMPGCTTATEMFSAMDAGTNIIKFFPAIEGSDKTLGALRSVLPCELLVYPVGGINLENMDVFIKAGANGFGVGSSLYKPGMSPEQISKLALKLVEKIKQLKL